MTVAVVAPAMRMMMKRTTRIPAPLDCRGSSSSLPSSTLSQFLPVKPASHMHATLLPSAMSTHAPTPEHACPDLSAGHESAHVSPKRPASQSHAPCSPGPASCRTTQRPAPEHASPCLSTGHSYSHIAPVRPGSHSHVAPGDPARPGSSTSSWFCAFLGSLKRHVPWPEHARPSASAGHVTSHAAPAAPASHSQYAPLPMFPLLHVPRPEHAPNKLSAGEFE
mmetsp:Transcript_5698/g.17986  ORF Transcript_5698/g.17986 Transcript_5698/m.17986 type:complete len:222 (+) Transcript_5698:226-891(+)